jgi:hypothetical protein
MYFHGFSVRGSFDSGKLPEAGKASRALLQDASYISFSMENCDDLKQGRLGTVNDGVIGISGQCPETERAGCEVRPGMATRGGLGNKRASVVNRLFYAVGSGFAVLRDVRPNVKNIRFSKGRESVRAHRLDNRQSSFIT